MSTHLRNGPAMLHEAGWQIQPWKHHPSGKETPVVTLDDTDPDRAYATTMAAYRRAELLREVRTALIGRVFK